MHECYRVFLPAQPPNRSQLGPFPPNKECFFLKSSTLAIASANLCLIAGNLPLNRVCRPLLGADASPCRCAYCVMKSLNADFDFPGSCWGSALFVGDNIFVRKMPDIFCPSPLCEHSPTRFHNWQNSWTHKPKKMAERSPRVQFREKVSNSPLRGFDSQSGKINGNEVIAVTVTLRTE